MSLYTGVVDGRRIRVGSLKGGPGGLASVQPLVLDSQVVTLSGSNPTTVQFPEMSQVIMAQVTLLGTSIAGSGLDPVIFTYVIDGTTANKVDVYAWKFTSNANPTLIASSNNTVQVCVIALGVRRQGQSQ